MKQVTELVKRVIWYGVILLVVVIFVVFSIFVPLAKQTQILELLKVVTWPTVVIFVVLVFHPMVKEFVNRATSVTLDIPGGNKITLTVARAEDVLNAMLKEVDVLLDVDSDGIKPEAYYEFMQMDKNGHAQISIKFERHWPYHEQVLRPLRERHLIRPSHGGPWRPGQYIDTNLRSKIPF